MFHLHRFDVVRRGRNGNAYLACRCDDRKIRHPDRGQPMDYTWIERGTFTEMPTRGPIGCPSGQAAAR